MSLISIFAPKERLPSIVNVAIWGPPQSGKTILMAMINSACESYGWAVLPAKKQTSEYIEEVTKYLFELGEPTPPTRVIQPEIHRFILRNPSERRSEFVLEMPDAAGEFYAEPEHEMFNMVEYLNGCHGIVWLIDPIAIQNSQLYGRYERSYRQMIYRTLSRMYQTHCQSSGQIDKYMAFVLTKMDCPDHSMHFDDPRGYALDLLGRQVERIIENFCMVERVEFFSTSALGFADAERTISNLDDTDPAHAKLRTTDIIPVGVFDPFNWLLQGIL